MTETTASSLDAPTWMRQWLDRRMPPANAITLNQRSIFILPTREGLLFGVLIVMMLMAGINYQNSLIYALAFLLMSFYMVSILHTWRNLAGLTIQAGGTSSAFAGEDVEFDVILTRGGERTYEALTAGWDEDLMQGADLLEETEERLKLFVPSSERGWLNPGRLHIRTLYPVGLFRAWSWVDLDTQALVYPRPVPAGAVPPSPATSGEGDAQLQEGADDFHALRSYQDGDSLHHVAWKSYARTDEMHTKQYAGYADRRVWLDWDHFQGMDREARLSRLCYWVLQLRHTNDAYGLRLPGLEIPPQQGEEHCREILRALALFEVDSGRTGSSLESP